MNCKQQSKNITIIQLHFTLDLIFHGAVVTLLRCAAKTLCDIKCTLF